ncbi:MAG: hypothetical protein QGI77_08450, partial [Roseibacillus sp.]|nr:hypothetical protein [Roseibacillus sp.]
GAATLNNSLEVTGPAAFSGELRLEGQQVTDPKHAATKEYVDQKDTHLEYEIHANRAMSDYSDDELEAVLQGEIQVSRAMSDASDDQLANSLQEEIRVANDSRPAKAAARVASLGNVEFQNAVEIDGVTLAVGDRVLLAGQANAAENGLYVSNGAGGLTRASDFDSAGEIDGGAHLFIQEGVEAGQGYVLGDLGENFDLGTNELSFTRFTVDPVRSLELGQDLTVANNSAIGGTLAVTGDAIFNGAIDASRIHAGQSLALDSAGPLDLNSSGGAINIGNDADAQAINIGTGAAARTITLGNDGATKVDVNALAIELDSAGTIALDSTTTIDINAMGSLDLNAGAGGIDIESLGGISLDAVGTPSHFTVNSD